MDCVAYWHLFLTVVWSWEVQDQDAADAVSGEDPLPGRKKALIPSSSSKGTDPMVGSTSHCKKALPRWGLGLQHRNLGDANISPSVCGRDEILQVTPPGFPEVEEQ